MTASASVVEALREALAGDHEVEAMSEERLDRILDFEEHVGMVAGPGDSATLCWADQRALIAEAVLAYRARVILSTLTPQPAEQDAREAVARAVRDSIITTEFGTAVDVEHLTASVSALTQAAPDGWRLVPVEPTPEMIEAACGEGKDHPLLKYLTSEERSGPAIFPLSTWRAMLSASPAPPAQGVGG